MGKAGSSVLCRDEILNPQQLLSSYISTCTHLIGCDLVPRQRAFRLGEEGPEEQQGMDQKAHRVHGLKAVRPDFLSRFVRLSEECDGGRGVCGNLRIRHPRVRDAPVHAAQKTVGWECPAAHLRKRNGNAAPARKHTPSTGHHTSVACVYVCCLRTLLPIKLGTCETATIAERKHLQGTDYRSCGKIRRKHWP